MPSWEYQREYEGKFMSSQNSLFSNETITKMFDCDIKPLWTDGATFKGVV